MNLYKFMDFANEKIEGLYSSKIWFPSRTKLNDPYDAIFCTLENINSFLDEEKTRSLNLEILKFAHEKGYLTKALRQHTNHPTLGLDVQYTLQLLDSGIESSSEAYSFLLAKGPKSLIDKLSTKIYQHLLSNVLNTPICCFFQENDNSTKKDKFLMWSHYADGFRGFALQFDGEKIFNSNPKIQASKVVTYSDKRPLFNPVKFLYEHFVTNSKDELSQILVYRALKLDCWTYEREIRFFTSEEGLHQFDPNSLTKILVGEKMPTWQRQVLINLARDVFPHVKVELVRLSKINFDFEYEVIYEAQPHAVTEGNGD